MNICSETPTLGIEVDGTIGNFFSFFFVVWIQQPKGPTMKKVFLLSTLVTIAVAGSTAAQSQGAATGAATGAVGGAVVGGPVGAAVGAGIGAVAGGIADDARPRFRTYVTERKHPS